MSQLKQYHESMRRVEELESRFHTARGPEAAQLAFDLQKARDELREHRRAWEEERAQLTTEARTRLAYEAAKDELEQAKPGTAVLVDEAASPLVHIKKLIRECRKRLEQARQENKVLYAQLKANRDTKRELNAEYERLRAEKKQLEGDGRED